MTKSRELAGNWHCAAHSEGTKVSHYRFFICWTRILPNGTTSNINEKGISFYRSLIEELKANSIEPIAVLFHADYPFELYQRGGWLNPECIQWYLDFCQLCFERFGDLRYNVVAMSSATPFCLS
ncbi:hypothetical protein ANCCEY_09745 [Ancylostoma ceylanicum]|uniref:Glycosyl hydrolase, family 1 n=1 Tax=Ancylostoma ceylanicum TaxID=53326 RepID=A0A0D6LGQ0_9BILA|nr:hypothetical protein ANCCEY_09745 [Ancylostoma ceylanicum]